MAFFLHELIQYAYSKIVFETKLKGPMGLDGFTECPGVCPTTCGLEDMVCPGAMDGNGCMAKETCQPRHGPPGKDGLPCQNPCPAACGPEEMVCVTGMDMNGCMRPDMCVPDQGPMDLNGNPCPAFCPMICDEGYMMCPGFMDATGCMNPNTCQSTC